MTAAHLLTDANLSPTPSTSRLPELPFIDWAFDGRNDFAAVWVAADDAVLHFHPEDRRIYQDLFAVLETGSVEWGRVGELLVAGAPSSA